MRRILLIVIAGAAIVPFSPGPKTGRQPSVASVAAPAAAPVPALLPALLPESALTVAADAVSHQGLTFSLSRPQVSTSLLTMAPIGNFSPARRDGARLVYDSADRRSSLVLRPTPTGVKEDLLILDPCAMQSAFAWTLETLPIVEPRLDDDGSIGLYLKSDAQVSLASASLGKRFGLLPAPVVRDARGREIAARFELALPFVTIVVQPDPSAVYPVDVDPTLVLTSDSQFREQGNDEGLARFEGGQVQRDRTGAWQIPSYAAAGSFTTGRRSHATVIHNKFLYIVLGYNGTDVGDIQVAQVNDNGTVGAFVATTTIPAPARHGCGVTAYNGYLYVVTGGSTSQLYAEVWIAKLNPDGTISPGAWTAGPTFPSGGRHHPAAAAANGFLYVTGGDTNGSGPSSAVFSAAVRADGSLGAWTTPTPMNNFRMEHGCFAYDGHLYAVGGHNGSFPIATAEFARINPDGTLGAWVATTALPSARNGMATVVSGGSAFALGGNPTGTSVLAAPVLPGGGLGPWTATLSLSVERVRLGAAVYNNRIFIAGGADVANTTYAGTVASGLPAAGHGPWTSTTSFATARKNASAVAYHGFMYIIGGFLGGSSYTSDVQYAPINPDGTLGSWAPTTSLPTTLGVAGAVACNGRIYIAGGTFPGVVVDTVRFAPINADGSLGSWVTTTSMSVPRAGHALHLYNGRLYAYGGGNLGGELSSSDYATINTDGTVGAWTISSSFNGTPRSSFASAVHAGRLYLFGGYFNPPGGFTDVEFAPINADGSVGAWTITTSLPAPKYQHVAAVFNGRVYTVGGNGPDVLSAPINVDGTIGAWTLVGALPAGRDEHSYAANNGFFYVLGGAVSGVGLVNDVLFSRITTHGTVGPWTATMSFPGSARHNCPSVAHNGFLYLVGGRTDVGGALNDVQFAPINLDGTVGPWTATNAFPTPRWGATTVVHNGFIYLLGGRDGPTDFNLVSYAPINANGSLGSWTATTPLPTARNGQGTVVYAGRLYILGGSAPLQNDVQFAPFNADGSIGAWTATTAFPTPRSQPVSFAYNGRLYLTSGAGASGPLNDSHFASFNADGTIGAWTETTFTPRPRTASSGFARDGYAYIIGGTHSPGFTNEVLSAPILQNGALGSWQGTVGCITARQGCGSAVSGTFVYLLGGVVNPSTGAGDNTVQFSPLRTPAPRATYSKLVDFGADTTVSTILTNGSGNGVVTFEYRTCPDGVLPATFGATTTVSTLTFGSAVAVNVSARYWQLRYTLDDSKIDCVNPDFTGQTKIDDITLISTTPPADPAGLGQFQNDTTTVIPVGKGAVTTEVIFKATLTDPDGGDQIRMHIEARPIGTPFTAYQVVSSFVNSGQTAQASLILSAGTQYHWRCLAEDTTGTFSAPVSFGANLDPGDTDFFINQPATAAAAMGQFESDGSTVIPETNPTTSSTVVFKATRSDPDSLSLVKVQLELRPFSVGLVGPASPLIDGITFFETTALAPGAQGSLTVTGLALDTYHWQMRCIDDNGAASAWTEFGAAGNIDFSVVSANSAPDVPASLLQFENNGTTPILQAGFAAAAAVKFQGTLSDPNGADTVKLQVELRATGVAFTSPILPVIDNVVFFETALLAPGAVQAAVTIPADGSYHWQARTVDSAGAASAWTVFGTNTDPNDADIVLDLVNDPPTISAPSVGQFQSDGTTAIAEGGNATTVGVVFRATPVDPNGNTVRLQIELRPFASPLVGTFTLESSLAASGTAISIPSGVLALDSYHWQYRSVDSLGSPSAWTEFITIGNTDFIVVTNSAPAASSLAQFKSDGITPLALGESTTPGTVVFSATVTDVEALTCKVQVEVQPIGTAFTGAFTQEGTFVASGATATVTVSGLTDDAYHWQIRAVDSQGAVGTFSSFGGNSETDADFRVDTIDGAPSSPFFVGQYIPPGDVGLALGGAPFGRTVVVRAIASEPEHGAIAYQVEVQSIGTAFTGTPTQSSVFGPPGVFASVTLSDLGDGAFHWQIRAIDINAQPSPWLSYGGNSESDADFVITATTAVPPNAPLSLQQKTSNGLAVIQVGDTIAQAAARFRALVVHPRTEIVKLQVEVKPLSSPFTGTPDKESGFVDSGTTSEVQIFGFPNDGYHWQARTVDSKGTVSAWVSYGGNGESELDFSVNVPVNTAPAAPGLPEQYRADGVTAIALGGATSQSTVVFHAFLVDADGDSIRLELELKPIGVAFDGALSGISAFLPNGSDIYLAVGSIASGRYHWRVRATDSNGTSSTWSAYAGNPETDADFVVRASDNVTAAAASTLQQLRDDGTVAVDAGSISGPGELTFRSDASDPDGDLLRLEVEVRPASQVFTGVATHTGSFVPSGFVADAIVDRFPFDAGMKWQARILDVNGATTGWVDYGANGSEADFTASFTIVGGSGKQKLCGLFGLDLLLVPLLLLALRRRR